MSTQAELLAKSESLYHKYRYTLYNEIAGTHVLNEAPDGWNDEFTTARHPVFHGLFRTYSEQTLHFVKQAREYLWIVRESQGINATVTFTIERIDEDWAFETIFTGVVLIHSLKFTDIIAEAQIEDVGALSKFHARKNAVLDVYGTETLDGIAMSSLTEQLTLPQQDFTLLASWTSIDAIDEADLPITNNIFEMTLEGSEFSDDTIQTPNTGVPVNNTAAAFYINSDGVTAFNGTLSGTIRRNPTLDGETMDFYLRIYKPDNTQLSNTLIALTNVSTGIDAMLHTFTVPVSHRAVLLFSFSADLPLDVPGFAFTRDGLPTVIEMRGVESSLSQIQIRGVNIYTAFDRLVEMTSGLDFYSDYLDNSSGVLISLTTGKCIRGKPDKVPLSIDRLFTSASVPFPLGLTYDVSLGKIRVEERDYFYSTTVGLDISARISAGDIEIEYMNDFFNQVNFGFSKSDSEFRNGLGEFNSKVEYSTSVKFDKSRSNLSAYRGDTIGISKLREKPILSYPHEDVKGDEDVWMVSTVVDGATWKAKTSEGYDLAPTEWYNLDFAPGRAIRRHRIHEYIPSGSSLKLEKRAKDTTLVSQETGQDAIDELANIPATDFPARRFRPEKITVRVNLTVAEVDALNWIQLIKLSDDLSGWIMKLTKNYKNNECTLELLRAW